MGDRKKRICYNQDVRFFSPLYFKKNALDRSLVSFLLGWEKEKRSIDKIKISGVGSIPFWAERASVRFRRCLFLCLGMGENGARLCQNGKNGAKEGFWHAGEGLDCHRK